jgi:hypothetical protein
MFGMVNPDAGLTSGMWLIGILILCLCGIFPMEYKTGMYKILNASPNGHGDTVRMKLLLSGAVVLIAFIIASIPDFVYTRDYYGFAGLTTTVASIYPNPDGWPPVIGSFPGFMAGFPIWLYIGIMLLLRLSVFTGIMLIILAISLRIKNNAYTVIICAALLLFPLFMYTFGLDFVGYITLKELITVNGLIVDPKWYKALQVFIFTVLSAGSGWYVVKKFGKT